MCSLQQRMITRHCFILLTGSKYHMISYFYRNMYMFISPSGLQIALTYRFLFPVQKSSVERLGECPRSYFPFIDECQLPGHAPRPLVTWQATLLYEGLKDFIHVVMHLPSLLVWWFLSSGTLG